jgi:hypothetical protein
MSEAHVCAITPSDLDRFSAGVLAVGAVVDRIERRLLKWKPERSDASAESGREPI